MANQVVTTVIDNGPRWLVTKTSFVLDTADMAETVIQDPAMANFADPNMSTPPTQLALVAIVFSIQNPIAVRLQWKATANKEAFVLFDSQDLCWEDVGFIHNDSIGQPGSTGQLVAITNGWTAATVSGSFTVKSAKVNG